MAGPIPTCASCRSSGPSAAGGGRRELLEQLPERVEELQPRGELIGFDGRVWVRRWFRVVVPPELRESRLPVLKDRSSVPMTEDTSPSVPYRPALGDQRAGPVFGTARRGSRCVCCRGVVSVAAGLGAANDEHREPQVLRAGVDHVCNARGLSGEGELP